MESLHMTLSTIFVLAVPTFCRIYPSPIDDAIQPEISYGHVSQVLAKPTKNVKHHEHLDQKRFPDSGGSAEGGNDGNSGGYPPDTFYYVDGHVCLGHNWEVNAWKNAMAVLQQRCRTTTTLLLFY